MCADYDLRIKFQENIVNIMKPDFIIEGLRGSVFTPQIVSNWEFISAMQEVLPNYIPFIVSDAPQVIKGMLLSPEAWMLVSPDNNVRVVFQAQKIDYIIVNTNMPYTQENVQVLTKKCSRVFEKIMKVKNIKASRLAIAPTLRYVGDVISLKTFINRVYAKNTFKKSNVDNCDFSQVFRVDEEINGGTFTINYLSKFYVATPMVVVNGINSIQEVNMLDFDINTFVNPTYSFDVSAVNDFFEKAVGFCSEFLSWYLKE